jgi:hypothetical protein
VTTRRRGDEVRRSRALAGTADLAWRHVPVVRATPASLVGARLIDGTGRRMKPV